jgi:hypothetical protein
MHRSLNPEIKSSSQGLEMALIDSRAFALLQEQLSDLNFDVKSFLKAWFGMKLSAEPSSGDSTGMPFVIDKSVPKTKEGVLGMLELADPSKIIFVIRQPLDQIEDEFRCKIRKSADKARFAQELPAKFEKKAAFIDLFVNLVRSLPGQVAIVRYESLVLDHEKSLSEISKWLGVNFQYTSYKHLDLAVSSRNIGIKPQLALDGPEPFQALEMAHKRATALALC